MRTEKEHRDKLNLVFNESSINWFKIKANSIEVFLDCTSMSSDRNFQEDK